MYDEEMIESCKKSVEKVIGKGYGRIVNYVGEDFYYFTRDLGCKSSYLGIGAEAIPGLHLEIVNDRLGGRLVCRNY